MTNKISELFKNAGNDDDILKLGIKGELEVTVKDKDGNVVSHEISHNTVTKQAKRNILKMLAGTIYDTVNGEMYATGSTSSRSFVATQGSGDLLVPLKVDKTINATTNNSGLLVSGMQYFDASYSGAVITEDNGAFDGKHNLFPIKMLFGTGEETDTAIEGKAVVTNKDDVSNYYSNNTNKMVTYNNDNAPLPASDEPTADSTAVIGAIKNGTIALTSDSAKIDTTNLCAVDAWKGVGRPAFIYCKESETTRDETQTDSISATFKCVMPSNSVFYPYNNWVLKQAGLFCDARNATITSTVLADLNSVTGQLLFVKNITPVLKTKDNSIEFKWKVTLSLN